MTIPVDTANHPILSGIKDVSFIPGSAAATLGVPITKTNTVMVKTNADGTKVAIKKLDNGKVVQLPGTIVTKTLPNGKVVEVRKTPDGRTIPVTPKPKPASAQPIAPRFSGPKRAPRFFGPKRVVTQPNLRRGNRVIIRRADGRAEYINILGIDVFDENGRMIRDNLRASILPAIYANDPGQFGPRFLTDGIHTEKFRKGGFRLPHTTNDPNARMIINLGSDRLISKIVVWNRVNCCSERIVGCRLVIRNSRNKVVLSHKITVTRPVYVFRFGRHGVIHD
jgi:hypothetical protein